MQIFLRLRKISSQTLSVIPLQIRRATVDDLPALQALWTTANLPAPELEGRLTEFQVVESNGEFVGAIGVQIVRQHLRFYAEDFTDFSVADAARELLWERIQKLAANHGVFRVWTQEASPFWTRWGFQPANAATLERLPDEWKNKSNNDPDAPKRSEGGWLTLELKNEDAIKTALGDQFANFMDSEKQQTAIVADRARKIRAFFTVVFFGLAAISFAVLFYLLAHRNPFSR